MQDESPARAAERHAFAADGNGWLHRAAQPTPAKCLPFAGSWRGGGGHAMSAGKPRGAIYVLHAFQKKSTRGIATPRREIGLIGGRYTRAREHYAVHYATREER